MSKNAIVYGAIDPRTGCLCYIGCTVTTLKARVAGYRSQMNEVTRDGFSCSPFLAWLFDLESKGMKPDCFEIERVPVEQRGDAENFWMEYFRFLGCDLLNRKRVYPWYRNLSLPAPHRR